MQSNSFLIEFENLNIQIPEDIGYPEEEGIINEIIGKLNEYIINNNIQIKRGDIIDTVKYEERYRNEGKFIWTGFEVIELSFDIDEYGAVHNSFIVSPNNFSPGYWVNNIAHNNFYFPCYQWRNEVCETLICNSLYSLTDTLYGFFIYNGKPHYVFIEKENFDVDSTKRNIMNYKNPFTFLYIEEVTLKENFEREEDFSSLISFFEEEEDDYIMK